MITDKVIITMIRELGDDFGCCYKLSSKDADYVGKVIKELIEYCESRKIEK